MIKFSEKYKKLQNKGIKNLDEERGISRYSNSKYLEYVNEYREDEYPLRMRSSSRMNYNVKSGYVYSSFSDKSIEYIMITGIEGIGHSVSAYIKNSCNMRERVGALYYRIEPENSNIAIKSYVVHNDFARQGIGGNILKTVLRAENDLLKKANIYVHACAGGSGDKQLSQEELERHYEKYGFVLCGECYAGAYNGLPPKAYVRENLLRQMDIALNL